MSDDEQVYPCLIFAEVLDDGRRTTVVRLPIRECDRVPIDDEKAQSDLRIEYIRIASHFAAERFAEEYIKAPPLHLQTILVVHEEDCVTVGLADSVPSMTNPFL